MLEEDVRSDWTAADLAGEDVGLAGLVGGETALTLERWLRIEDGENERDTSDAAELAGVLRETSARVSLLMSSSGKPSTSGSGSASSRPSFSENSVRGTANFSTSSHFS